MKKNQYNFSVIVERDEDGYVVTCPELQGCYTQGGTYEEALANIEDAIRLHLEDLRATKQQVPRSRIVSLANVFVAA